MTQRGKPLLIDEENYDPGRSARRKAKQEHIKSILDQFVEDKDLDSFFTSILYKI